MTEQTIVTAPSVTDIVDAFSVAVIARLAEVGLPPLQDGRIFLGRQHLAETAAPPRIVFVPVGAKYGPRSVSGAAKVPHPTSEQRREIQQRSIKTEVIVFEVHCWGQAIPADEDQDWNAARALHHMVLQAAQRLAPGLWDATKGEWTDGKPTAAQHGRAGREFVFLLEIPTPVLDDLLPYTPTGTGFTADVVENAPSGTPIETVVVA